MKSSQRGSPIKPSQPGVVPEDVLSNESIARIAQKMKARQPVDLSQYQKTAQVDFQVGDKVVIKNDQILGGLEGEVVSLEPEGNYDTPAVLVRTKEGEYDIFVEDLEKIASKPITALKIAQVDFQVGDKVTITDDPILGGLEGEVVSLDPKHPSERPTVSVSTAEGIMDVWVDNLEKSASKSTILKIAKLAEIPKDFEPLGTGMYRQGHHLWSLSQEGDGFMLVRAKEELDDDEDEEKDAYAEQPPGGGKSRVDAPGGYTPPMFPRASRVAQSDKDDEDEEEKKEDKKKAVDSTAKEYYETYFPDGYGAALTEDKRSLMAPIVARAYFRLMGRTMPPEQYGKRPEWAKLASKYGKSIAKDIVTWIGEGITQRKIAQKFGVHPLAGLEWKEVIREVGPRNAQLLRTALYKEGDKRHLQASYNIETLRKASKAKDLELRARTRKRSVDEAAKAYFSLYYGLYGEELTKNIRELVVGAPRG